MNAKEIEQLSEIIDEAMERRLKPIREEVKALQGGGLLADSYKGTFDAEIEYARGNLITEAGSLWLCVHGTKGRPGKSPDWRLIVKGGAR